MNSSIFLGTIESSLNGSLLVGRKRKAVYGEAFSLVPVETDAHTVVNEKGRSIPIEALQRGTEVIISGIPTDSGVYASKLIVRG